MFPLSLRERDRVRGYKQERAKRTPSTQKQKMSFKKGKIL
jgi:hypothetical protein